MRALVVYESMYGNTHVVASNIADGLRATHEVTLVPVAGATADLVPGADLVVVGGPTHMHGMSERHHPADGGAGGRQTGQRAEPGPGRGRTRASRPAQVDRRPDALAAAFDTRVSGVPAFTGRASRGIGRLLKRHGYRLIAPRRASWSARRAHCSTARPPGPAAGGPRSASSRAVSIARPPPDVQPRSERAQGPLRRGAAARTLDRG